MDWTFEFGLLGKWYRDFDELAIELNFERKRMLGERRRARRVRDKEKKFLDFNSIAPFFLLLVFGFSLAGLVLSFEIFYSDFLSNLSKEYFKRKFHEIFHVKRKKPKRKIIQVKPKDDLN